MQQNSTDIRKRKSFWNKLTGSEQEAEAVPAQPQTRVETSRVERVEVESEEEPAEQVETTTESDEGQGEEWMEEQYEGQLSVDVFQTTNDIVIKSTIAGVKPEDIDISIQNDMITVRGQRQKEEKVKEEDYFYQECYWGGFSRSIILPVEVRTDKIDATLKDGVLTVVLPKARKSKAVTVRVKRGI